MYELTAHEAYVLAVFAASALWGVYLMTFAYCLRSLFSSDSHIRPLDQLRHPIVIVCLIQPILATSGVAVGLLRAVKLVSPNGLSTEFLSIGGPYEIICFVIIELQTIIGDGMLVSSVHA